MPGPAAASSYAPGRFERIAAICIRQDGVGEPSIGCGGGDEDDGDGFAIGPAHASGRRALALERSEGRGEDRRDGRDGRRPSRAGS